MGRRSGEGRGAVGVRNGWEEWRGEGSGGSEEWVGRVEGSGGREEMGDGRSREGMGEWRGDGRSRWEE